MSRNKQHVIAYCADNQQVANQLAAELTALGYSVQKTEISNSSDLPLLQAVVRPEGNILLLITDNFIKSRGCMNGALEALKEWSASANLMPVVADGQRVTNEGMKETVPTSFDRVSAIIQYMNYWQDRYLDLRKEKRHHETDEKLELELETTKVISAEVGEFLRYLRNLNWLTMDHFKNDHFRAFRQLSGEDELAQTSGHLPVDTTAAPLESQSKSLAELIQDSSEELMAENIELSAPRPTVPQDDTPPSNQANIPDMDMSDDAARLAGPAASLSPAGNDEETDDNEVNAILNEVLGEDDDDSEEFHFLSEDPDNLEEFDLDSLFEDEPAVKGKKIKDDARIEEDEILLNLVSDDEEGLVLKADGKGHATPDEVLEHAVDLFEEGQLEEGLEYLKKTVKLNPSDNTLRYYYAFALARYGERWKAARKQLDTILEKDEEHPDAWFLLAEIAELQGNYAEAKQFFEKVATLQPDYPEVFYRLGLLTVQHFGDQAPKAAGYFKKAITHNTKNVEAHYLLATLLNEQLDDPESAIDYFKTTLRLHPTHPFANYDLALTYFRLGEKATASDYYQRAIAINPELKTPQNDVAFAIEIKQPATLSASLTGDNESTLTSSEPLIETPAFSPADEPAGSVEMTEPQNELVVHFNGKDANSEVLPASELSDVNDLEDTIKAIAVTAEIAEQFTPVLPPILEFEAPAPEAHIDTTEIAEPAEATVVEKPVVLITGATAGIGRATAEVFAANGYQVIATGRRADLLDDLQNDFKEKFNNHIQVLHFDVRDASAVTEAIEKLPEAWRNVDILINNAGLSRGLAPIHEGDLEHWDTMIDTNIKGLLYMTRAIAPQMVSRRSGHIINVASGAGKEVYPGGNVYCATKAAVDMLTRGMRLDLHKYNVRVSQVAPGHVEETEFASVRFDGDTEKAARVYENFQPLKASDVAETIFFIATRPTHVNIQDVLMFGTQQAGSNLIDRSGR